MSQPFTFPPPPPPPPPPKPQHNSTYQQPSFRGGSRGRGGYHNGQQDGRGRGQYPPRGRGGYGGRGNSMNHSRGGHAPYTQDHSMPSTSAPSQQGYANPSMGHAQKRNHSTAFNNRPDNAARNHRPAAPLAVPSFGIDFNSLLPKKPETPSQSQKPPAKKANLLGLTPVARGGNEDSEEDDEEEESKLASTISTSSLLQFEYKGQTATLNTPEEIAAWIAERRKKWPTEQKREVAQREAEERRKKWEAEKAARMEAGKAAAKARQEERLKQKVEKEKSQIRQKLLREQIQKAKAAPAIDGTQTAAQAKAEKLRRKAEKIAQQLKKAEAALDKHEDGVEGNPAAEPDLDALLAQVDSIASAQGAEATEIDMPDNASDTSDATSSEADAILNDDTSTSGSSSESDSDAPPEESTTKRIAPDRVLPPARKPQPRSSTDNRPICKNFAQSGRCKFGRKCHFKHENPGKKEESAIGNRRKGLYQVMVEKEQEEERQTALRVIIALGKAGVLDEETKEPEKAAAVSLF
ncbi:hypothetical protein OHC33_005835 [Knufia fluminis]|uniref:C3H1-type domain-containing protein n=1 Tax=Knufia fluminis TaxID=191047 RepID=A0AAN8I3W8_9EURO|nr:hypothetical protein OHC33_005835 [Knufia fluminis]